MPTPDDIKKGLSCCENTDCDACPYNYYGTAVQCLPALAFDTLAYIDQIEQRLASVGEMIHEWISVKDRLPEYYKDVLVIVRNNGALFTIIAYLTICGIWVHKGFGRVIGVVTNWMPLPDATKEDSHE